MLSEYKAKEFGEPPFCEAILREMLLMIQTVLMRRRAEEEEAVRQEQPCGMASCSRQIALRLGPRSNSKQWKVFISQL